jgi:pyruvate dehydrogenase E1 component alpha subunit
MDAKALLTLYGQMARMREFELALADLWHAGRISGEMHLGTGEEAIAAGIAARLGADDAVAIDHRSTPFLTALGVDLVAMLREMLGDERGLCRGRGGHMHLFVPERRLASSGIVGAAGPVACGFALSARRLRPRSVAVALFGEGAMNEGMLMESLNLASVWSLPVLFVCKDNGWAVFTESASVTGGGLCERVRSFGIPVWTVDGADVAAVQADAAEALDGIRSRPGPAFLHATCGRLDGHLLGDPMVKLARHPIREGTEMLSDVAAASMSRRGGGLRARLASVVGMMSSLHNVRRHERGGGLDPLDRARKQLRNHRQEIERLDAEARDEIAAAVASALEGAAA